MSSGLNIGSLELNGPAVLAPMAGITDTPFRSLCRAWGASLAASEMTTADMRLWHTDKSRRRLDFGADPAPHVVQIAGSEPAMMAEAARYVVARGAAAVDINLGCPAKKVCRRLAGSALLRDPELVARILTAVVNAVAVPVTLKMRTGWDPEHRNGVEIARIAEQAGIAALAVHGRTRACAYRGPAEYATIRQIKSAVSIPIFANGDVDSPKKAAQVLEQTGADGVMIGRGAQGRPWLFQQVNTYLQKKILLPAPSLLERRDIVIGHLDAMYRFYGERTGLRVARKHLAWYAADANCAEKYRSRVVRAESTSEQMRITKKFFAGCDQTGGDATPGDLPPRNRCSGEDEFQYPVERQAHAESVQETGEPSQKATA
jgi:tRNA-dihydrouridine synthase B